MVHLQWKDGGDSRIVPPRVKADAMLVGSYGINPGLCVGVGVGGATVRVAVGVGTGVWGGIPEVGGMGTRLKS
jgi:hypothetical protein